MKFYIINGPNLNLLGQREPELYGTETYADLLKTLETHGREIAAETVFFQSNHEGALIDFIQSAIGEADGIILNAGGYTHTSIAIRDAVAAVNIPTVEVHLTDISQREEFRKVSYLTAVCAKTLMGKGFHSYIEAMDFLKTVIENDK